MDINPILYTEIDAVVHQDCERFMSRRAKAMTEAQRDHFKDDIAVDIQKFFEHYGVPCNEETLTIAMVGLLWSTNATASMFAGNNNPVASENNNPYGIAVHGGLAAIDALAHAIRNFQE